MRKAWQKIQNNLLNPKAFEVLGPALFARYASTFFQTFPQILKSRNFAPLDQRMGPWAREFHYRGKSFIFDCAYCDDVIQDGSYAFGAARELYIRDCYFCHQPPHIYNQAKVAVDLGCNRGSFTSLMTTRAQRIVSVEAQKQFLPLIQHNINCNGFRAHSLVNAFIGAGGMYQNDGVPFLMMEELMEQEGIASIDFLKMDIEGSEFALFASPDWLDRIRAISMEVHLDYGKVDELVKPLHDKGFQVVMANDNLVKVPHLDESGFLYAWRS
ncbi:MAG: FkbM family methyltransferase [Myxococcales bacterium]|nr:FkbM family methyltransferase [Myxococcales bacterium]